MGNTPIDNLKIVVTADHGSAAAGIMSIAEAMRDIKSASKGSFKGIDRLADSLKNLGASIYSINMSKFNQIVSGLSKLNGFKFSMNISNSKSKSKRGGSLTTIFGGGIGGGSNGSGTTAGGFEGGSGDSSGGTTSIDTKSLMRDIPKIALTLEKLKTAFQGLAKSLGRIAMYRILRTLIKQIGDAFSTGMQNVYAFSKKFNTQFAKTMDNISTSLLYMKNGLGTALSEVLMSLEPVIIRLADNIAEFGNNLAEAFAFLRGSDQYNKAIKFWKEYNDEVAKATRTILKFDEINKLNGNDNNEQNTDDMFEIADVSKKNAFGTLGKVAGGITLFAAIKGALQLLWNKVFGNILSGSSSGLLGSTSTTIWEKIATFFTATGTKIATGIKGLWPSIKGAYDALMIKISSIFGGGGGGAASGGAASSSGFATAGGLASLLGVGLAITGITISANTDLNVDDSELKQRIEQILGPGLAAIGGALSFGPAGMVISAGIALALQIGKNTDYIIDKAHQQSRGLPEVPTTSPDWDANSPFMSKFLPSNVLLKGKESGMTFDTSQLYDDTSVMDRDIASRQLVIELVTDGIVTNRKTIDDINKVNTRNGKVAFPIGGLQ